MPVFKLGGVPHAYNPAGYVRGGATPQVAKAIQTAATGPVIKKAAAVKVQDPMTRITNRLIAGMLTPKQLQTQAATNVDAQIKIALAGMKSTSDATQAQLRQQEDRAHGYALALGSLRDMSGIQTEADYQNAASRIQGLGTGLTGTVADAQQAAANDAASRIAAATGGLGTAKGLDVAGLRNVAQYTGVAVPATNLYEEAASQAAQARLQQDMRGQQVENLAADYRAKEATGLADLQRQETQLQTTRPSLYQTALSGLQGGGRSDVATIISALALQNTAAKTPSEIGLTKAKTGATKTGAVATTAKAGAATTNAATGAAKVFGTDAKGNLAGGFYWQVPGKVAQKIPSGLRIWEGDPTSTVLVPAKGDFYWTSPGFTTAAPVPKNKMLNPKDPTHHSIIDNTAAIPRGSTKTPADIAAKAAKATQALIKQWSSTIDKSLLAPGTKFVRDTSDPFEEKQGYAKPHYVPAMSYPEAFAAMIAQVPPSLRKNPQMIANINATLRRGGYKIGGAPTPKKAKPTAPKTVVGPNLFGT